MYLNRGGSSRFKLFKSQILSNNLKLSSKNARNNSGNDLPELKDVDSENKCLKDEPSSSDITFEDSSTFVSDFYEFSNILNNRLLKSLEKNGFIKTTPIQRDSIPKILEGSTVLIRSPSGTGKTLTFLVPAIQRLICPLDNKKITRKDGTKVLIITPTRELSYQITEVAERLSKPFPWIVVSCIKGGESRKSEKARIRKGITIVVGTPGRVLDHMESTSSFNVSNLDMLVLDEADRLLDMGFEAKIRTIHSYLLDSKVSNRENAGIQIVLTSATITDRVKKLVDTCLVSNPIMIGIDEENLEVPTNLNLEYVLVDCNNKFMCLVSLLLNFVDNHEKIIVFVSNCDTVIYFEKLLKSLSWPTLRKPEHSVNKVLKNLDLDYSEVNNKVSFDTNLHSDNDLDMNHNRNYNNNHNNENKNRNKNKMFQVPIFKLHGDMESKERMVCMDQFIKSDCSILISTDVASRGLNLSKVNRVVQYDPPQQLDEFIHRSGRTARIGDSGTCVLLLMKHEREFVELLNRRGIDLEEIDESFVWNSIKDTHTPKHLKKFKGDLVGFIRNMFCSDVKQNDELMELGRNSYKSSIRSYKTYSKELRSIFNFKRLHLGHYATSFCLNIKPTELINSFKNSYKSRLDNKNNSGLRKRKNVNKIHSDRPIKEPRIMLSTESQEATEKALKYLKDNNMIL